MVTYTTGGGSGKTALIGAWTNASPSFIVGASATIPTFGVTGGGTLDTDYSVAYSRVSGTLATVDAITGITDINTEATGTATVKATVTVINTTDYTMETTEYNCVITVVNPDYTFAPTETSGDIAENDVVETSTGGVMKFTPAASGATLKYTANGVEFGGNSSCWTTVTLYKKMQVGTQITITYYNASDDKARGLGIGNSSMSLKANFQDTGVGNYTHTYTVVAGDGLAGSNVFMVKRNNNSYLKSLIVGNCAEGAGGTITPAGWASFSSSMPLDLSTISGGTAYYASAASGSTVTLKETTAIVPANEGLMIKGTAGEVFIISKAATSGTAIEDNLLKPSTGASVDASTDGTYHYVFGYKTSDATEYGFYNLSEATIVPAGKAYLETTTALTPAAPDAPILFSLDGNDETANISTTNFTNDTNKSGEVYNLNGQRVAQPTKGLYIVNGKKVIVR